MNGNDKPLTRQDLVDLGIATKTDIQDAVREFREYVLDRENNAFWKIITLQITLILALNAGSWAIIAFLFVHWKPS